MCEKEAAIDEYSGRSNLYGCKNERREESTMIKIRLMGTEEEINWMERQLCQMPQIRVLDSSDVFQLYGTNRFFRKYLQVEGLKHEREVFEKEKVL